MKRSILTGLLILALSGIFHTTSFAAENQTITMKNEITEKLTNYVAVSSDYATIVSWGDGTTSTINSGEEVEVNHTYATTGIYDIKITGTDITGLRFTYAGITEINLSSVSTLEKLNVSGNKISTLNLSKNTSLKELKCGNNILTTLSVANINTLKVLDCRYNQLSSLTTASGIEELYVQGNKLNVLNSVNAFDLSKYSALKVLNCESNNIENIIVSGNNLLSELYCNDNLIRNLDLSNNRFLKNINCDNNLLNGLNLTNNTNLMKISCNNNEISNLDASLLTNLEELKAIGNDGINVVVSTPKLLVVDNDAIITGNSATTIKVQVSGKGTIRLNNNKINLYPDNNSIVENIILNGNNQNITEGYINFSNYSGINILEIIFTSEEAIVSKLKVNRPELFEEMIPLKHNGRNWVITIPEDPEWYDYNKNNAKWANVMLRDGAKYLDYDGKPLDIEEDSDYTTLIGKEVPVEHTGSMYVWIPRYTYKIVGNSINIKYSNDVWDDTQDEYLVHPAFNYKNYLGGIASNNINYKNGLNDEDKLKGLWVAKYQASDDISAPKYYETGNNLLNVSIGDAFTASQINNTLDGKSHMIKNTEWGAVAYLATAIGASNGESTTDNVYGVYNMNSGAEYVSHYIELIGGISNNSVRKNAISMIPYPMIKYNHIENNIANASDIDVLRLTDAEDSANSNYQNLLNIHGIGIKDEIGTGITGAITKNMPNGENAFFVRGIDGIYSYSASNGAMYNNTGFRHVLLPGTYNLGETREYFNIISQSEGNGSISPLGTTTVLKGNDITYAIVWNEGAELIDVKVDNISVRNELSYHNNYATYTFNNVNSNHEIFAKFASNVEKYEVTVRINPENSGYTNGSGYITKDGEKYTFNSRTTASINAIPNYGYSFLNWEIIEGNVSVNSLSDKNLNFIMPDSNVILQANFETAAEALLTVINGDTITSGYENVGTPITVNAVIKPGYEFVGWEYQGIDLSDQYTNTTLNFNMPATDVTIRAIHIYKYSRYTVSYDSNASGYIVLNMPVSQIKTHDEDLQLSEKEPYIEDDPLIFKGWEDRSAGVVYAPGDNFSVNKDITLYAVWEENIDIPSTYTIQYVVGGNIVEDMTQTKTHDVDIKLRDSIQVPDGYTFQGWRDIDTGVVYEAGANFQENKDTILEAILQVSKVMIYVETINSKAYGEENVGETITVNATTVDEYVFTHWTVEGINDLTDEQLKNSTLTFVVPANDVRLIANYGNEIINVYNANVIVNPEEGGSVSGTGSKTVGETVKLIASINTGYTFNGFEVVSGIEEINCIENVVTFTMPSNNVTLRVNYIANTYTVNFDANGGEIATPTSKTVTYGEAYGTLAETSREGYAFVGWYTQAGAGSEVTSETKVRNAEDHTLYAHWEEKVAENVKYKVQHWKQKIEGGETQNSTNYELATEDTEILTANAGTSVKPSVNEYEGFTSPSTQTVTIASDGSTEVNYYYTRNSYTFTLGSCTGVTTSDSSTTGSYKYGETITLVAKADAGYTWNKWTSSNTSLVEDTTTSSTTFVMPAGNITMTPSVTANIYTVTATANPSGYGSITGGGNKEYGSTVTLTATANAGYKFTGWSVVGGGVTLSSTPTTTFTMPASNVEIIGNFEVDAARMMPDFTYTDANGNILAEGVGYKTINEGKNGDVQNWRIEFLQSGILTFNRVADAGDLFVLGAGGAGAKGIKENANAVGGGGSYQTVENINLSTNTPYTIIIGEGGETHGEAGGNSSALGYTANGGGAATVGSPLYINCKMTKVTGAGIYQYAHEGGENFRDLDTVFDSGTSFELACDSYGNFIQPPEPIYMNGEIYTGGNLYKGRDGYYYRGSPYDYTVVCSNGVDGTGASVTQIFEDGDFVSGSGEVSNATRLGQGGGTSSIIGGNGSVIIRNTRYYQGYLVMFDANGGTGAPTSQRKVPGTNLTLTTAVPSREGYEFIGWNTASDGSGNSYASGGIYSTDAKVRLYAMWDPKLIVLEDKLDLRVVYGNNDASDTETATLNLDLTGVKTLSFNISVSHGYLNDAAANLSLIANETEIESINLLANSQTTYYSWDVSSINNITLKLYGYANGGYYYEDGKKKYYESSVGPISIYNITLAY